MPTNQGNNSLGASFAHAANGKLRNKPDIMLDLHVQIIWSKNICALFNYSDQRARCEAMIKVVGNPRLKAARGFLSNRSSAIDKMFLNSGDFSDMGMHGGEIPIG